MQLHKDTGNSGGQFQVEVDLSFLDQFLSSGTMSTERQDLGDSSDSIVVFM